MAVQRFGSEFVPGYYYSQEQSQKNTPTVCKSGVYCYVYRRFKDHGCRTAWTRTRNETILMMIIHNECERDRATAGSESKGTIAVS